MERCIYLQLSFFSPMKKTNKKKFVARFVHVDTAHLEEDYEFKLSIAQPSPNTMTWQNFFKLELQDDPLKMVCR